MAGNGWITLDRSILDHHVSSNPSLFLLWVKMLLMANHADNKLTVGNKVVTIKRGQLMTSRKSLATATGLNQSKIERLLKCLETEQQIEQQSATKYRLITITNYDKYQKREQQVNSKRTASEQQVNTNNNVNNDNNVNNKHKGGEKEQVILPEWLNKTAWAEFVQHRKDIKKPLTPTAAKKNINILEAHQADQQTIIDNTIANRWTGLFAPKNNGGSQNERPRSLSAPERVRQAIKERDEQARQQPERHVGSGDG